MRMLCPAITLAAMLLCPAVNAQSRIKVGIINDGSGVYSDNSGPGGVVAGQIAIDEFKAEHPGVTVDYVSADHLNKPDVATTIVRRWYDVDGVDMVVDIQNSSISLAVQNLANQMGKITMVTGGVTPELFNQYCSATGVDFTMDAYALSIGPVQSLPDRKKWFFITVDLAGGHLFEEAAASAVRASGGEVVGRARHPLGTSDMSAYVLSAQTAGAEAVGLANSGTDAINTIKAAQEFGLMQSGVKIAPLLFSDTEIRAAGLELTKGMVIGTGYYWDLNDATRGFGQKFFARFGRMPTQLQAGVYASTWHYLKAVMAAKTTESAAVMAKMREMPFDYFSPHAGYLRPDGRVIYDTYVMQVKSPAESTAPWDIMKLVRVIPMEQAFRPLSASECPLLKQ